MLVKLLVYYFGLLSNVVRISSKKTFRYFMRNVLVFIFLSLFIFNPSISAQSGDTGVLSYLKENARWGWYDYGKEEEDG